MAHFTPSRYMNALTDSAVGGAPANVRDEIMGNAMLVTLLLQLRSSLESLLSQVVLAQTSREVEDLIGGVEKLVTGTSADAKRAGASKGVLEVLTGVGSLVLCTVKGFRAA